MSGWFHGCLRDVSALLLGAAVCAGAAQAEVRVTEAGGDRLTVEAHDATLGQVLDALRAVRPLHLHATGALNRPVTGTYSGSLPRVLSRILDGYDHVIHLTATGIELDVLGVGQGERASAPAAGTVTVVRNIGQRVSSNVDQDEEAARAPAAPPRAARTVPPVVPVQPAVLTGSAEPSGARRISSNVDLDEERTSR